jgi:VIT1/CCC1 family predicted Fe2+/Mn2+ transporter
MSIPFTTNRWHKFTNEGGLRPSILGMNDGLVSNFCLLMGISGGTSNAETTNIALLAGIAAMIAGAFSMAAGEYISVLSEKDTLKHQINFIKKSLTNHPEIASNKISDVIICDPIIALDTIAKETFGGNIKQLGSPNKAAASSFIAFIVGAFIPLSPFFISGKQNSIIISGTLSLLSLFIVGGLIANMNNKNILYGSLKMMAIGSFAATITYGIGYIIGIYL